jgi:hypothetical protein
MSVSYDQRVELLDLSFLRYKYEVFHTWFQHTEIQFADGHVLICSNIRFTNFLSC